MKTIAVLLGVVLFAGAVLAQDDNGDCEKLEGDLKSSVDNVCDYVWYETSVHEELPVTILTTALTLGFTELDSATDDSACKTAVKNQVCAAAFPRCVDGDSLAPCQHLCDAVLDECTDVLDLDGDDEWKGLLVTWLRTVCDELPEETGDQQCTDAAPEPLLSVLGGAGATAAISAAILLLLVIPLAIFVMKKRREMNYDHPDPTALPKAGFGSFDASSAGSAMTETSNATRASGGSKSSRGSGGKGARMTQASGMSRTSSTSSGNSGRSGRSKGSRRSKGSKRSKGSRA